MIKTSRIPYIVLGGSMLVAVGATVAGGSTSLDAILGSLTYVGIGLVLLGMLPMTVVRAIVAGVGRKRGLVFDADVVWWPGLLYILSAAYSGWIMGQAFRIAEQHQAGSEFLPLIIIYVWVTTAWVPVVLGVIIGIAALGRARRK